MRMGRLPLGIMVAGHQSQLAAGQQRPDKRAMRPVTAAAADAVLLPAIMERIDGLQPAQLTRQGTVKVPGTRPSLDGDQLLAAVLVDIVGVEYLGHSRDRMPFPARFLYHQEPQTTSGNPSPSTSTQTMSVPVAGLSRSMNSWR